MTILSLKKKKNAFVCVSWVWMYTHLFTLNVIITDLEKYAHVSVLLSCISVVSLFLAAKQINYKNAIFNLSSANMMIPLAATHIGE